MDTTYLLRSIFHGEDEPFVMPAKPPTAAELFGGWVAQKLETASTRKALYGLIVVLAHRYFADIRKYPADQEALHAVFQQSFETIAERILELDPLLPDGERLIDGAGEPPQAAGAFYQDLT